ncbi:MAG TPA: conditioned medium factor, partial [Planctomycetota bacterium]|nr:conditioned medium factor [Planctomycetota bacterium]
PRRPGLHPITPAMLTGNASATIGSASAPPSGFAANRALMLVHGYCSSGSIWPAADFAQPKIEFLDPSANRSHDQFAQLIAQRAVNAHVSSFGIVAHSQGGPAALHLLTYYTSGLDFSTGGRRIQSLASPYLGTPLASWGGFACGVNNDMTPAASATWLAGIPTWARAEVFTWTTADSGTACNAITNLLLTNPEDGTVEKMRSELAGGNNMGHVVGWCHTTGMTNPASYTDHTRNLAMNAAAAR